jgi:hypothetical protein
VTRAECEKVIGEFLDGLATLDSRLDIGMNYEEYGNEVSGINVSYDAFEVDDIPGPKCLAVARSAETAFNYYIAAYRKWDRCLFDRYDCEVEIDTNVQDKWADASRYLGFAEDELSEMP